MIVRGMSREGAASRGQGLQWANSEVAEAEDEHCPNRGEMTCRLTIFADVSWCSFDFATLQLTWSIRNCTSSWKENVICSYQGLAVGV